MISIQVIHHNLHNKIKFCISEIERALKPDGVIFITVAAKRHKRNTTKSKMIESRTYIPLDGEEKGLPHFFYNKNLMKKDFRNFKILNIHKDKGNHYRLLGKLK